jgi:vacuolar-type H+-ATPase subunit I/STV1
MSTTQNETISIEQAIRTALNGRGMGSYFDQYARPVVVALNARETDLSERLVDYAVDAGGDAAEVRAYLREIGMAVADEPEDEADDEDGSDESNTRIASTLERIERTLEGLTSFARANGYRG